MEMEQSVKERTFKQMLWIAMISMTMMFAGLTSAYVVSRGREDWVSFELGEGQSAEVFVLTVAEAGSLSAARASSPQSPYSRTPP